MTTRPLAGRAVSRPTTPNTPRPVRVHTRHGELIEVDGEQACGADGVRSRD